MQIQLTFRIYIQIRYQFSMSVEAQRTTLNTAESLSSTTSDMHSLKHAAHAICQSHQIKKHIHGKAHLAVAVCKCADQATVHLGAFLSGILASTASWFESSSAGMFERSSVSWLRVTVACKPIWVGPWGDRRGHIQKPYHIKLPIRIFPQPKLIQRFISTILISSCIPVKLNMKKHNIHFTFQKNINFTS